MDTCTALTRRVEHLEFDKVAQALEITKLKRRVKKLERRNKVRVLKLRRLQRVRTAQRVETSDETMLDDVSNQGRMITEMDKDTDVVLEDVKEVADKAKEVADAVKDVEESLSMQDDETKPAEVQDVVDVVTTAKLITEVVTASSETNTAASINITTAEAQVPAVTLTTAHAVLNKNIDWDEAIDHVKRKAKEVPVVKRYQLLKRKPQTEAQDRKNMMVYLKNVDGFKMDYFKGMSYDDIRPIFEAKFNSNRATKRQKLDEEVEELKRHLQIMPIEDNDVYTEATLLARKVPVVDYQIIELNNKPYYKIIRVDDTHQLYVSFLIFLRNFDREDLEALWSLVKERFSTTKPKNFYDDFLLVTLGAMFEKPNIHAQIWKTQRNLQGPAKVKGWKLLESCVKVKTADEKCCYWNKIEEMAKGKVELTNEVPEPPPLLKELVTNKLLKSANGESSSSKNDQLDYKLTTDIRDLLDEINPLVKNFRMVGEPHEVAALIVGDFDSTKHKRNIILQCQDGDFKRINAYTMIESERLSFNRKNDKDMRSETYSKLATLAHNKDSGVKLQGKKRFLKSEDRLDVISRVFKIKLDCLMKEIKDDHILDVFKEIDKYISSEIPNKDEDPELYQLVTDHMMHGSCNADNPSCPCTVDYKCTKKFPKQFNDLTVIDDSGYAVYKRRNDGSTIKKSGKDLHNGYIVSYNPNLQRRYQAQINVEYCNQIHYRTSSIERLLFHLKDEQHVIFDATESIDYAVVWEKTWTVMGQDVLFVERIKQNKQDKLKEQYVKLYKSLMSEQKDIYYTVMNAVDKDKGGMFVVYGYNGTRKTYVYKTMSAALHSKVEDSMCHIAADSDLAELIRKAKTDTTVAFDKVFGGKVVLFGGDFQQILPVITNRGRHDVVNATINASYIWQKCTILRLTVNMRLGSRATEFEKKEIQEFADWILDIGNGKVSGANDGMSAIVFPYNMLILETDDDEKSILAPTHEMVDIINQRMLSLLIGDEKDYESSDSVCLVDDDSNFDNSIYTTVFLNGIRMSGIPYHSIKLKIGTPIMLMCNIDQRSGLCNETRLQILRVGENIIEAKIITGASAGTICAIPRMIISLTDTKTPFKLNRRQFPIQV
uniref:ATP-dependent DNA helicase n=1 Tax=Tanacetum cinerariifolium TaxID=118510 RepID=A0A6L2LFF5_TANCI|nr:ATP-dependent DNA helicase PIF1-like [Tanacetum cinerariifolium]